MVFHRSFGRQRNCRREMIHPQSPEDVIFMGNPPHRGGGNPRGHVPPLTPNFDLFFRCVFTAMLHGARVDTSRAPVATSLSNTVPYRFSTEPKYSIPSLCSPAFSPAIAHPGFQEEYYNDFNRGGLSSYPPGKQSKILPDF